MSLTAVIFALVYFTGLILTFYNPVYGVITYIFEWHNHPPYFWWGDALPDLRWSYTIALATLISFFINRNRLKPMLVKPDLKILIWVCFIILNMFVVSYMFALFPDASFEKTMDVVNKLMLFYLLVSLMRTQQDYRILMWVIIVCVSHMGFIAWDVGSNRDIGVIAPNATEENALSAHVMAMLPFFGIYFLLSNRWQKIFILLAVPFCLNLIILANSRATVVGLMAIGMFSVLLMRGKYRMIVVVGIIGATALFLNLTNESFSERQQTDVSDNSAQSRLWIWGGAYEMWKEHPMGVGDGGFEELSMSYIPEINSPKSQHNTFVAIFTDWGLIGLLLYLGFLAHAFFITMQVKRLSKWRPELRWYYLNTTAIQLALIGISAAGIFHSRQYAEVVYWLIAFAVAQKRLVENEIAEIDLEESEETPEAELIPVSENGNGLPIGQRQGMG